MKHHSVLAPFSFAFSPQTLEINLPSFPKAKDFQGSQRRFVVHAIPEKAKHEDAAARISSVFVRLCSEATDGGGGG